MFLTLEQVFGRIKSLSVYRSTSMLTGKVFARTFRTRTGSCFSIAARKNRRGSVHWRGIQYRVSIVLACTSRSQVYWRSYIAVRSHFLRSYPIHGVTPRDLIWQTLKKWLSSVWWNAVKLSTREEVSISSFISDNTV